MFLFSPSVKHIQSACRVRNNLSHTRINSFCKAAESVSPDDGNTEGTDAPRRTSGRNRGNKANIVESVSPEDGNTEGTDVPRRTSGRSRGNQANGMMDSLTDVREISTNPKDEIHCMAPSDPVNGRVTYSSLEYGTELTYECNVGFLLKEHEPRICSEDGRWSNEEPECIEARCEDPQDPQHGFVTLHGEPKVGSLATYSCNPGRRLVGAATTTCLITGKWTFDPPQCLNNSVCASPPKIEGAITPTPEDTEYAVGTTVTYSCNFGYVSRNSIHHISGCKINETTRIPEWTVPAITCIPRSCGDPGYVNNGQRIGNLFTFPNKVEYECEEGFKLRGLRARYCQAGGDWSGRLPTCDQIYCAAPSDPVNGRVKYSSLEYGTELRYECNVGFLLKKHEPRICSEDGSWSNEQPECIEARCEIPQAPEHGAVKLHGEPKVGSLVTYSCDPGKRLVGAATTKCLITGQWTFDTPQCLSSCSVPYIENGEMGKFQTRTTRWDSYEEFKKVYTGEQVNSNETLFLQCKRGFLPLDDSKFLESNRIEVTCNDGAWSKALRCEQTSCTGAPPSIKNGKAEIGGREHGYSIWYSCKIRNSVKVKGNVTCHFGTWIGIPPKCLNSPCYTSHLQEKPNYPSQQRYPGLIIPSQEHFESQEGFDIYCEDGFRKATTARKINCNGGRWDISQNPCIDERDDKTTSIPQPEKISPGSEVPHVVNIELPDNQNLHVDRNRGCFCTYNYDNRFLKAQIGYKMLKRGDKVMRGETVSLECPRTKALTWQNGFRYLGKVNMTCSTCEKWQSKDLPTCRNVIRGDSFIAFDKDFEILPGGIIDLQRGESRRFLCSNTYAQPVWNHVIKWGMSLTRAQAPLKENVMYMEILDIRNVRDEHSGKYECCIRGDFGRCIGSSFLELQVNASDISCPPIDGLGIFSIYYDYQRRINSTASFMCKESGKRVEGCSVMTCLPNRTWSGSYPICVDREERRTISTTPPGKTSPEECFCTYDYENPFLKAQIGHRKLKRGDNIMRGETVSFECKFVSRVLLSWQNGLRFFGKANMTCNTCKKWQSKDLPTCNSTMPVDAVIGYEEDLKILPGGIVDMRKGESRQFFCSSSWNQPQWDYGEKKDVSVNITQVSGQGNVIFVSFLDIMRAEEGHGGKYECYVRGDYGQRIGSSFLDLQVDDDVSCSRFPYSPELTITYSKNVSIGSIATFSCSSSTKKLIGSSVSTCKENRSWSNPLPSCEDYMSCSRFPDSPGLKITYSKDVSVGSIATFSCSPSSKSLIVSSVSVCRENGSWSNPVPSCEESRCSVHDLSLSVPEDVVPDMTGVNDEFLPSGSVVELKCNDNFIINGNSRALCGEHGKWEFGSIQCVPGCILNIDRSSHLLVEPMKDSYRLGEFISLSCPPWKKMSSDVERLMCLSGGWSDSIPHCE